MSVARINMLLAEHRAVQQQAVCEVRPADRRAAILHEDCHSLIDELYALRLSGYDDPSQPIDKVDFSVFD